MNESVEDILRWFNSRFLITISNSGIDAWLLVVDSTAFVCWVRDRLLAKG